MSSAKKIGTDDFDREVLKSDTPVLVDFYADWCGPCRAMAPAVDALAEKAAGRYKVVKVDVDPNPDLAVRFEIRSIPSLLIFRDGEVVFHHRGFAAPGKLSAALEEAGGLAAGSCGAPGTPVGESGGDGLS